LLQERRTALSHLIQSLSSMPPIKPEGQIDSEGFPLPTADLELLREGRMRQRQLNEAQNDYKRVMREIEELLPLAFERDNNKMDQ
jgi:Nas2 N_terminal domain